MNNILKKAKEYIALIGAILLFFLFPYGARLIDPTSGIYDTGILQVIFVTLIQFAIYMAVVWSVTKTIWPDLGNYFKVHFSAEFKTLTSWQRAKLSLSVYFSLFVLLALLSRVI